MSTPYREKSFNTSKGAELSEVAMVQRQQLIGLAVRSTNSLTSVISLRRFSSLKNSYGNFSLKLYLMKTSLRVSVSPIVDVLEEEADNVKDSIGRETLEMSSIRKSL